MSGKFINKTYVNTIDSLTQGTINKVKTANYVFNDKTPVICNWYNLNNKATTLDEGTRAEYSSLGKKSPMRFNKITEAIFYTRNIRIELEEEYSDEGLGVSGMPSIAGIVLPNTWVPYQGDFFTFTHAGKEWMYKVNAVSFDTIDNNNNIYRFEAMLDNIGTKAIEEQVVDRFRMIINNVGTNFNAVINEESYLTIDILDNILLKLKDYYIALFYNDRVQTFTYEGYYGNLYDPYMIEFLIRNKIMEGSTEYVFVHHEIPIPRTFSIEYNDTYFRALETKTTSLFNNNTYHADIIDNSYSLFSTVKEEYYMIDYKDKGLQRYTTLDPDFVRRVHTGELYENQSYHSIYNIIIRYMNGMKIDSNIIPIIENIEFVKSDNNLFYVIPMIIFIIENSIKKLMT
ncbi:MAG: hypothetical protein ACI4V7_09535 [Succinivibrionaceae bacterium]